jgi:hypothetical protein
MRRLFAVLSVAGTLTLASPAGPALAEAGGPASCMGHEASGISPPGSSDEIPSGMPGLKAFIDQAFPGVPPGVVFSTIAGLHEGSHEGCDEALEG